MRRWTVRIAVVPAVVLGGVLLHQGLVLGARTQGALGRTAGRTCAACH